MYLSCFPMPLLEHICQWRHTRADDADGALLDCPNARSPDSFCSRLLSWTILRPAEEAFIKNLRVTSSSLHLRSVTTRKTLQIHMLVGRLARSGRLSETGLLSRHTRYRRGRQHKAVTFSFSSYLGSISLGAGGVTG